MQEGVELGRDGERGDAERYKRAMKVSIVMNGYMAVGVETAR